MINTAPAVPMFQEGDEVLLAEGSHQGTLGVFLCFKEDPNWADILERNGTVRSHPVLWLAHASGEIRSQLLPAMDKPALISVKNETVAKGRRPPKAPPEIDTWEGEGGAVSPSATPSVTPLSGTEAQVEWAQRIKAQVDAEFDRVAKSFRTVARRQAAEMHIGTEAVIAILEDKRAEVMRRSEAGYFIHNWQEIGDQVRQMILLDPRYLSLKKKRASHQE